MSEGWILDAHLRSGSDLVTVWVKEDSGAVSEHSFRWSPVIHVSGRPESLHELEVFLTGSVCAPCSALSVSPRRVVWSAMVAMTPWKYSQSGCPVRLA